MRLAAQCGRIICQTEEAKAALGALVRAGDRGVVVLPPMVPAIDSSPRAAPDPAAPRLAYSGKFSPPYMILEMLDAFEKIRAHSCRG